MAWMGVRLGDLFPRHPVPEGWYAAKTIAVDAHNVSFRYLTTIRGRDGGLLRGPSGRPIGHLLGLTGLVRQFRAAGAEPILVWDGEVHPRKEDTVRERIQRRQKTMERAQAARAAGDEAEYRRLLRGTLHLSHDMIRDATRAMETVGVAVVTADHDGERYAAALCAAGHAQAVATEDFDALVAGAPRVLRKAGGRAPFLHRLQDLDAHGLEMRQLRQVAIVTGTDWHPGIRGFGPKTALKAVQEHNDLRRLWRDVEAGREPTRAHRLVAQGGMDLETFEDLEAFLAQAPTPEKPRRAQPCPEMATETAVELGLPPERLMHCFC